jgi:hypothetical protein
MIDDLRAAPVGAVVLLHACAHNPTGVDPTEEQWEGIRKVIRSKQQLPFFDCAYQVAKLCLSFSKDLLRFHFDESLQPDLLRNPITNSVVLVCLLNPNGRYSMHILVTAVPDGLYVACQTFS